MSTLQFLRLLPNFSSFFWEELELLLPESLQYTDCSSAALVLLSV